MSHRVRLLPAAVAALTFVAFLPALDGEFLHWDDDVNFVNNPHYRGLGWPQLQWMFTTTRLAVYSPLAWMTLGLNYLLGGMDPWGYHLGNLLLHAGNAALFYFVARRVLAAALAAPTPGAIACGAAAAALAFGVHPLRVESVAWVTERRDVLCGWFYLLAALAYLRGAAAGGRVRGWWLGWSLGAFGAALLAKGIAMTLPLTLLLLDVYPLRRWRSAWRSALWEKLPYAALAGLGALAALIAVDRGSTWQGYETYGAGARVAMVAYSVGFSPWKLVWPEGLSPLYELPAHVDPLELRFLVPLVAVAGVTAGLVLLRWRFPGGLAAWIHSAIVLLPVSGLVHAGNQLAADRFSYLSGLGFALVAGAGVTWALGEWQRARLRGWVAALVTAAAALAALGWGAGTWRQSTIWRNSESLWEAAVASDPTCAICSSNLGGALMEGRPSGDPRLDQAEMLFRHAMLLRPGYPDPYRSLGALLGNQRRYGEAEIVLQAMMRRFPHLADGPTRLASVYIAQGRYLEAIALLGSTLRVYPHLHDARPELGRALTSQPARRAGSGAPAEAVRLLEEALAGLPSEAQPLESLGRILVEAGKGQEALAPLRRAVTLDPQRGSARFWLARAYLLVGERDLADAELRVLRALDPGLADRFTGPP